MGCRQARVDGSRRHCDRLGGGSDEERATRLHAVLAPGGAHDPHAFHADKYGETKRDDRRAHDHDQDHGPDHNAGDDHGADDDGTHDDDSSEHDDQLDHYILHDDHRGHDNDRLNEAAALSARLLQDGWTASR